jgi:hypothetical protein
MTMLFVCKWGVEKDVYYRTQVGKKREHRDEGEEAEEGKKKKEDGLKWTQSETLKLADCSDEKKVGRIARIRLFL